MTTPYDLVTLAKAQTDLAAVLAPLPNQDALPDVISGASFAIRKHLGRDIVQTTRDECYDGNGYSAFLTRQYPIIAPLVRLATNPQQVLTISNRDSTTNQRANVSVTNTGDLDGGLVSTGLTVSRVASGVQIDIPFPFVLYPTIQSLANGINALGAGWTTTVLTGYGAWPSTDIRAVQGIQTALTSTGGTGASFKIHTQDINNYTVNERTGQVRLDNMTWDPVFALMNLAGGIPLSVFPPGFQNIRCIYTTGFPTIPADIVMACLFTIRDWMWKMNRVQFFKMEKFKDYQYELFMKLPFGLSDEVKGMLAPYRAYRRY